MMNEAKPFASLSSGLLARKGSAKPAMRPQAYGQFSGNLDDLGWNDMGHSAPRAPAPAAAETFAEPQHRPSPISALTPMGADYQVDEDFEPAPPVVEQQRAAIAASFAAPAEDRPVLATKAKKAEPEGEVEAETDVEAEAEVETEAFAAEPEPSPAPVAIAEPEPAPVRSPSPAERRKADAAARAKAAFTLRLDGERHLKLRLACAVSGRSAQQLVTEALDQLLQSKPEVEALAGQLPGAKH